MKRFRVLGVNDDRDFCECCGKKGLKKVVWIEDNETGEIKHYGTTCATQPQKGFKSEKEIKREIAKYDSLIKNANYCAHQLYRKNGYGYTKKDSFSWSVDNKVMFSTYLDLAKKEIKEKGWCSI